MDCNVEVGQFNPAGLDRKTRALAVIAPSANGSAANRIRQGRPDVLVDAHAEAWSPPHIANAEVAAKAQ